MRVARSTSAKANAIREHIAALRRRKTSHKTVARRLCVCAFERAAADLFSYDGATMIVLPLLALLFASAHANYHCSNQLRLLLPAPSCLLSIIFRSLILSCHTLFTPIEPS